MEAITIDQLLKGHYIVIRSGTNSEVIICKLAFNSGLKYIEYMQKIHVKLTIA